jgi:hypothetical protein
VDLVDAMPRARCTLKGLKLFGERRPPRLLILVFLVTNHSGPGKLDQWLIRLEIT